MRHKAITHKSVSFVSFVKTDPPTHVLLEMKLKNVKIPLRDGLLNPNVPSFATNLNFYAYFYGKSI